MRMSISCILGLENPTQERLVPSNTDFLDGEEFFDDDLPQRRRVVYEDEPKICIPEPDELYIKPDRGERVLRATAYVGIKISICNGRLRELS